MELSAPLTFGVGRVASAALIGRLPGIAVFGAGLIAGALVAALAGRPTVGSDEVHAGAAPALAMSAGERAAPWSARLLPGEAARSSARDAPQCGQAGSTAGKAEGGGRAGRDQHEPCLAPSLRIGILGSLTVNGQAGALVPAQSQLIVTLAQLRLAGGDPAAAVRAARIGLGADASAEQLWRIMMRAEHAAGNLAGVRGAWCRCLDVVSEVAADGQPDLATSAVYSELLAR